MAITLTRFAETRTCTPGKVEILGREFPTLELPYLDNAPFTSCIPVGTYQLVPYRSARYGLTYVAVNEELNVYFAADTVGRPDDGRYKCLYFHRGNYAHNFEGCAGVGRKWLPEMQMITETASTCAKVNQLIADEGSLVLIIGSEAADTGDTGDTGGGVEGPVISPITPTSTTSVAAMVPVGVTTISGFDENGVLSDITVVAGMRMRMRQSGVDIFGTVTSVSIAPLGDVFNMIHINLSLDGGASLSTGVFFDQVAIIYG